MNRIGLILLTFLAAGGACAQGAGGGVTMSTDPARAAAVESHARELQARQAEATSKPAATHKSTAKTTSSKHAKANTHAKSSTHAKADTHAKGKVHATHKSSSAKPAKPAKT